MRAANSGRLKLKEIFQQAGGNLRKHLYTLLGTTPGVWANPTCPTCGVALADPRLRLRLLVSPRGVNCPICSGRIGLQGNHWFAYLIGSILLILGGRLLSQSYPLVISLLLFVAGVVVIGWGVFTVSIVARN